MDSFGPIIVRVANSALQQLHHHDAVSRPVPVLQSDNHTNHNNNHNNNNNHDHVDGLDEYDNNETLGFFPWLQRILLAMLVSTVLVLMALATYGVFYISVMPALRVEEPLFFDYTCGSDRRPIGIIDLPKQPTTTVDSTTGTENCSASGHASNECESNLADTTGQSKSNSASSHTTTTTTTTTASSTSSTSCYPTARVDVLSRQSSWVAHHPDLEPPLLKKVLAARQEYFMELKVQLPETEVNRLTGIFVVQTDIASHNGTLLASAVRSIRMPHESVWISVARKLTCLLPLLVGAFTETKIVTIPALRHYKESKVLPLVSGYSDKGQTA